jgi:hypothetical protein
MICILHGWLLEGSGSNLWTRSIVTALARIVHLVSRRTTMTSMRPLVKLRARASRHSCAKSLPKSPAPAVDRQDSPGVRVG